MNREVLFIFSVRFDLELTIYAEFKSFKTRTGDRVRGEEK